MPELAENIFLRQGIADLLPESSLKGAFMRWITPQELAKITGTPERTIRHYASQNQLLTKRDGKKWVIEPMSAIKKGLKIPPEELEKLREPELLTDKAEDSLKQVEPKEPLEKKYKKLRELGVYKDLRDLLNKEASLPESIRENLKNSLTNMALGFFEYSKPLKVEFFRKARHFLVCAAVEADMSSSEEIPSWRVFIEDSLIAGTIGLIRQHEGVKRKSKDGAQGNSRFKKRDALN